VLVVRDAAHGPEVLMLQRNLESAFVPGVHVFPGGTLDPEDHAAEVHARCDGPDDAAASRVLGVEHGALDYWIAAIRELFEEAGVLLARDGGGALLALSEARAAARYQAHRDRVNSGDETFVTLLASEELRLAGDRLTYFARWITPEGAVRRYDTRFFVAEAPADQVVAHDNHETIAHEWVRPAEMLARHERGECKLRMPTLHTLKRIADFESAARLIAGIGTQADTAAVRPRVLRDGRVVLPGEPGYDEARIAGGRR